MKSFTTISSLLAIASTASAHFSIQQPTPLTKSSTESSPCGGATLSLEETSQFYVHGEPVQIKTGHPEVHILIRGTTDPSGEGNWTNLAPVIKQEGLGSFCEPGIKAPEEWVGKKGYLQVVQSGEDGLLFACAAVTFHGKRPESSTTLCSNGTGVTGEYSSDPRLPSDGLAFGAADNDDGDDNDDDSASTTTSPGASATSEAAEATSSAAENAAQRYVAGLGAIAAGVLGAALVI